MKKIHTNNAPAAIGPYSQAIACGDFLFTSGQIGLDPETGAVVEGGVKEQAERALQNLLAIIEEAGSTADKIVKTTCFLADMADFAAFNEVYAAYIPNAPARSCVAVRELPKSLLCEIEAIVSLK
jgi:2-iminobutanoate/2-iminopropanoate deaminase